MLQATGTCENCKRNDAPIEILQVDQENSFHGRCLACGAMIQGGLVLRTEPQAKSATPSA